MFSRFNVCATIFLLACCVSAQATSLQEFHAKSDREQAAFLSDYVLKMRNDVATKDPDLAQAIWTYFVRKQDGQKLSAGAEAFLVEELKVDALVKEGKVDPAKIPVEGLIVYVVKQKFRQ